MLTLGRLLALQPAPASTKWSPPPQIYNFRILQPPEITKFVCKSAGPTNIFISTKPLVKIIAPRVIWKNVFSVNTIKILLGVKNAHPARKLNKDSCWMGYATRNALQMVMLRELSKLIRPMLRKLVR